MSAPGEQNLAGQQCSFVPMEKPLLSWAPRHECKIHGHNYRSSVANSVIMSQEENSQSTFQRVRTLIQ